jgi:hypothetical protein
MVGLQHFPLEVDDFALKTELREFDSLNSRERVWRVSEGSGVGREGNLAT